MVDWFIDGIYTKNEKIQGNNLAKIEKIQGNNLPKNEKIQGNNLAKIEKIQGKKLKGMLLPPLSFLYQPPLAPPF